MFSVVIFLVFLTIFIAGEPSLLIYKTVNGTNHPITAIVRVVNGSNLTLNCRDVTSTQNEVSWSKKSSFHENVVGNEDSSKISFTPAKAGDDGVYVCTSVKSNLTRPISIVVYGSDLRNSRRLKRTQYGVPDFLQTNKQDINYPTVDNPVGNFFKNNDNQVKPTSYPSWLDKLTSLKLGDSENWPSWYTSNLASGNVPSRTDTLLHDLFQKSDDKPADKQGINYPTVDDPVGNFFKNNAKQQVKPTSRPSWLDQHKDMFTNLNLDGAENWPSYVRPGSNWYTSNLASGNMPSHTNTILDDLYKKSDDDKTEVLPDPHIGNNQYTILYCMVIVGGLLLFGGIMCMCVRNNTNVRAHLDRTTSLSPACTHAMCVRHRDTNPLAGCILSTLNSTNRIPTPMVHTNEDGDVTVLTFPNENIDTIDFDDVPDTPPSYSNTVDDIKSDLPPSYDEVLQNMLPPSYSSYQSTSTAMDYSTSQPSTPLVADA